MKTERVVFDGIEYARRMINGYYILCPITDGSINYDTYVYEHRLVYELYNNVKLTKDQHVHHINHIRNDNRPENLTVLSNSEHAYLHARENGYHSGTPYCIDCGTQLSSWKATRCVECSAQHRQVKGHPTKSQLAELILTMNNSEIARKFCVSDTAVKKWRRKYGLPSASEQRISKKDG